MMAVNYQTTGPLQLPDGLRQGIQWNENVVADPAVSVLVRPAAVDQGERNSGIDKVPEVAGRDLQREAGSTVRIICEPHGRVTPQE